MTFKRTGRIELDNVLAELDRINYATREVQGDCQLAAALALRHEISYRQAAAYVDQYRKQQEAEHEHPRRN